MDPYAVQVHSNELFWRVIAITEIYQIDELRIQYMTTRQFLICNCVIKCNRIPDEINLLVYYVLKVSKCTATWAPKKECMCVLRNWKIVNWKLWNVNVNNLVCSQRNYHLHSGLTMFFFAKKNFKKYWISINKTDDQTSFLSYCICCIILPSRQTNALRLWLLFYEYLWRVL
jgi:hypothetical protein